MCSSNDLFCIISLHLLKEPTNYRNIKQRKAGSRDDGGRRKEVNLPSERRCFWQVLILRAQQRNTFDVSLNHNGQIIDNSLGRSKGDYTETNATNGGGNL